MLTAWGGGGGNWLQEGTGTRFRQWSYNARGARKGSRGMLSRKPDVHPILYGIPVLLVIFGLVGYSVFSPYWYNLSAVQFALILVLAVLLTIGIALLSKTFVYIEQGTVAVYDTPSQKPSTKRTRSAEILTPGSHLVPRGSCIWVVRTMPKRVTLVESLAHTTPKKDTLKETLTFLDGLKATIEIRYVAVPDTSSAEQLWKYVDTDNRTSAPPSRQLKTQLKPLLKKLAATDRESFLAARQLVKAKLVDGLHPEEYGLKLAELAVSVHKIQDQEADHIMAAQWRRTRLHELETEAQARRAAGDSDKGIRKQISLLKMEIADEE